MGDETPAHAGKEAPAHELVLKLLEAVSEEPGAEWADEAVCVRYLIARNNHLDKAKVRKAEKRKERKRRKREERERQEAPGDENNTATETD